jgi:hypothetical protein
VSKEVPEMKVSSVRGDVDAMKVAIAALEAAAETGESARPGLMPCRV